MNDEIHKDAKVLIVSWAPVPTPKYQKIEGSGQRFFGLATGLQKNGVNDITIAVGAIYPLDVKEVSGIKLFNYDLDDEFAKHIAEYDTVIINYAIHGAAFVAKHLPEDMQVIFDVYGPAYIESLARDPEDLVGTYIGNLSAVNDVFNKILPRGDYFLYANDAQEKFYTGILSALGIINQFTYKTQRLLRVPFGIDYVPNPPKYQNPYAEYGIKNNDFVLLWFGGLYPWFDITKILDTLKSHKNDKLKLVIVGGNNPQNQHPDFVKHYHNTLEYIHENKLDDKVVLIDWVDYATRRKYYDYADVIISMNNEGKENVYSWRTRVMDYVGSDTPLITNGGDPLSDELIQVGAAFKVNDMMSDAVKHVIEDLESDRGKLEEASKRMRDLRPKYYWENVTKELAEKIIEQSKPHADEQDFRAQHGISGANTNVAGKVQTRSVKRLAGSVVRKIKNEGPRATYKIISDKIYRKATVQYQKRFPSAKPHKPRVVVISNQLNNTGAPFVLMDIIHDIKKRYPTLTKHIRLIAFTPIEAANISRLRKYGVKTEVYTNRELPLVDLHEGDIVVLNTFAISYTTIMHVLQAVDAGKVKKIFWYGHEASPEGFIPKDVKDKFVVLLKKNKAKIYAVSEQTRNEYGKFFGSTNNIEKMLFRFSFPEDKFRVRKQNDFEDLRFITTGSLMDMRKGQYPIVYAFLDFYHNYYLKNPDNYRNFHLELLGAYDKWDTDSRAPYHIRNIKKQLETSAAGLGKHFTMRPVVSREEAIKAINNANVTICYSLLEAMGIFVYEGMATGHPIIRNESAGQVEQLIDGKNGYAVHSNDFAGLVEVIEAILNKNKTKGSDLAAMSKMSNDIARKATDAEYPMIDEIVDAYNSNTQAVNR